MVRGPVIMDIEEENLLDVFEVICSVKDIRMIRNKMTGQLKDFAFIEFFTP
jgi:RNA recognition motif-containing protein